MFSGNEGWDIVHRPRTVKGVHGYKVFKLRRLKFAKRVLHTKRLKLECGCGFSFAIQLERFGVIERNVVNVKVYAARRFDVFKRLHYDGECLEPEEVHLDKSG